MDQLVIGIITVPINESGVVPLGNLIRIVKEITPNPVLITGGHGRLAIRNDSGIEVYEVSFKASRSNLRRTGEYLVTQIAMALKILRCKTKVNIWIFFYGGPDQILPMIMARLLGHKVVILFAGSSYQTASSKHGYFHQISSAFLRSIQTLTCSLANRIIIYSPRLKDIWKLGSWENKISIGHEHIIDADKFSITSPITKRKNIIGYVGRLSPEKGILELVKSMPYILDACGECSLMIIGEGEQRPLIEEFIDRNGLKDSIKLLGNHPHELLPKYFNEFKLLVIPSLTEGLPNVMLEAMACGTPVIVMPVGSIPDVISEGINGFIFTNRSPKRIAESIINVMSMPNLDKIVINARTFIENEYVFERSSSNIREIVMNIITK